VLVAQSVDEEARLLSSVVALVALPLFLLFSGNRPVGFELFALSSHLEITALALFFGSGLVSALLSIEPLTSTEFLVLTLMTLALCARAWGISAQGVYDGLGLYAFLGACTLVALTVLFGFEAEERLGSFRNPNGIGLLCYGCAVLSLFLHKWYLRAIALVFSFYILFLTGSRTSAIGMIVAFSAFWLPTLVAAAPWKKLAAAVLAFGAFIVAAIYWDALSGFLNDFFAVDDPHRGLTSGFSGRDVLWQYAWQLFVENPFFGVGFRLHDLYFAMSNPDIAMPGSAHNGFLAALAELGLVGSIPLFVWILSRLSPLWQSFWQDREARVLFAFVCGYVFIAMFERFLLALGNPTSLAFLLILARPGNRQYK
jgi:O-antigen ligase